MRYEIILQTGETIIGVSDANRPLIALKELRRKYPNLTKISIKK